MWAEIDKKRIGLMEKFEIKYDNSNAEIEVAYKLFQKKYMLRRNVIFSIVYAIATGLGINFAVLNSANMAGYILIVLGLGMLFSTWARPVYARKKLMKTLESFGGETYTATFAEKHITVDTEILPEEETETVAITRDGVMTVGEDVEIPPEQEIKHDKTKIELAANTLDSMETEEMFLLFLNRSLIYIFPKRCLSEEETEKVRGYFDDKNI